MRGHGGLEFFTGPFLQKVRRGMTPALFYKTSIELGVLTEASIVS
jgi:hypothetical protein